MQFGECDIRIARFWPFLTFLEVISVCVFLFFFENVVVEKERSREAVFTQAAEKNDYSFKALAFQIQIQIQA
jgi:hypothetical protein